MSEIEDPFILLEPSCDIHLVLGPLFPDDRRRVPLRVFRGEWNQLEGRHDLAAVTGNVEFDWFGLEGADPASIVTLEPPDSDGRWRLVPQARGQVLMQVRFMDPARPDKYDYLIARIWVHNTMDGWWFGHERWDLDVSSAGAMSVFKDETLAHSQPTVLALFDRDDPDSNGGIVADVSGHGYVQLTSDDPAICAVDTRYADRLRGVEVGETTIGGDLPLPFTDFASSAALVVRVIDPHMSPSNRLEPVSGYCDTSADPRTKLNLLFLAEGFTGVGPNAAADRARFDKAVYELTKGLLTLPRHQPYKLLAPHFNVWSHYEPSRHRGLTPGPQLTKTWWVKFRGGEYKEPVDSYATYIPQNVLPPDTTDPDSYSLPELLLLVGLPAANERRSVAELRAAWDDASSLPSFLGYQDDLADDRVIESWRRLIPLGIAVAPDTFYGLYQGSRWGDRFSLRGERAEMITQPAAGASDAARRAFAKRVHRWFNPRNVVRSLRFDPRRYAPEYHRAGLRLLVKYIARLVNPAGPDSAQRAVGRLWDVETPTETPGDVRHYNSAGLVCVIINSTYRAGTAEKDLMFRVTLGNEGHFPEGAGVFTHGRTRIIRHGAFWDYKIDYPHRVDALAHELGHSFYGLGDEYEQDRGNADPDVEDYDNLTYADNVIVRGITEDPDRPTPIDPDRIKWAWLHRIEKADTVLKQTEIGDSAGPERSRRIVVTLGPGRADAWRKALADEELVYLRRLNAAVGRHQLPIEDRDLYEELTIESIPDDHTVVLFGESALHPTPFPAGSILYVPKRDEATGVPLTIVREKVLDFLATESWDDVDPMFPPGRALTENHNEDDSKHSDRVQKTKDLPPDIPDFIAPCAPHRVVGLYEGGGTTTRRAYRPAGACKMRAHEDGGSEGEFCFVCKYLQVNLVDPTLHPEVDKLYPRPSWWKRFWKGGEE
jgi:hypothetical protein